jgi:hypothetical protein
MACLTELQTKCLKAWIDTDPDFDVLDFDNIADRSGVRRHLVRRVVREMKRRGVTRFARGCWTEDGEPAGSGYGLTDLGRTMMDEAYSNGD